MPYKIRNAEGLYSTGGMLPRFTRAGKTWSTLAALRCHLTSWSDYNGKIPREWYVEEHGPVRSVPASEVAK